MRPDALLLALALTSVASAKPKLSLELWGSRSRIVYEYHEILPLLKELQSQAKPGLVLSERDFEKATVDDWPASRLVFTLKREPWLKLSQKEPRWRHFRLLIDQEPLFGGLVYEEMGAAALRFPVVHFGAKDLQRQLKLGAVQGAFAGFDVQAEDRVRISPPSFREWFDGFQRATSRE